MEVKRKVVYMGERDVIQEARTMIKTLRTAFSSTVEGIFDAESLKILGYWIMMELIDVKRSL